MRFIVIVKLGMKLNFKVQFRLAIASFVRGNTLCLFSKQIVRVQTIHIHCTASNLMEMIFFQEENGSWMELSLKIEIFRNEINFDAIVSFFSPKVDFHSRVKFFWLNSNKKVLFWCQSTFRAHSFTTLWSKSLISSWKTKILSIFPPISSHIALRWFQTCFICGVLLFFFDIYFRWNIRFGEFSFWANLIKIKSNEIKNLFISPQFEQIEMIKWKEINKKNRNNLHSPFAGFSHISYKKCIRWSKW